MRQNESVGHWPINAINDLNDARAILQDRGFINTPYTLIGPAHIMDLLRKNITNTATSYWQFLKRNMLVNNFKILDEKRFKGNTNVVLCSVKIEFDCFPIPEFDFYAVEIVGIHGFDTTTNKGGPPE